MPVARARAIELDGVGEPTLLDEASHDPFRRGRTADIAQTNEADPNHPTLRSNQTRCDAAHRVWLEDRIAPVPRQPPRGVVCLADNLRVLRGIADACVDLVYIDPPFNTGKRQTRMELRTVRDAQGDRTGFGGHRYRTLRIGSRSYADVFDDYLAFLEPRLREAHRVLKKSGSLYLHLNCREVHYAKVLCDAIFDRRNFQNEIIWAYDYGARTKSRWPAKHDNILFYARSRDDCYFDAEAVDRIAYMAPGLVGPEKAARGKLPTDTWWHTIVSPTGKEKLGYPTQKPLGILRRIVQASSPKDGLVVDFFAGSGTAGMAALEEGRRFILVDSLPSAFDTMRRRFAGHPVRFARGSGLRREKFLDLVGPCKRVGTPEIDQELGEVSVEQEERDQV